MLQYLVIPLSEGYDVKQWVTIQRLHEIIRVRLKMEHGPAVIAKQFYLDTGGEAIIYENVGALAHSLSYFIAEPIVLTFDENELL
ncbi:MAG: hypothetical protein Q7S57_01235 [bacterium]|nr:hypothetical protein [bacterium]